MTLSTEPAKCQEVSNETLASVLMPWEIPDDKNQIFPSFQTLLPLALKREECLFTLVNKFLAPFNLEPL